MPPDPLALAILFLSTLSLRRATQITVMQATDAMPFLSTLSLRRATIPCGYFVTPIVFLSTLSLRRATLLIVAIRGIVLNFYPRSPCGERRSAQFLGAESGYFYPRSPCGERQQLCPLLAIRTNFYPRSPCGERRSDGFHRGAKVAISIHALLAESDYIAAAAAGSCPAFLSTLSLRRATR